MSRLVFICLYRNPGNGPRHQNLVRYMATREGVQFTNSMDADLPATDKQRLPTRGMADSFIQAGIEQAELHFDARKNFVDYMANRPKVQRVGKHGLFSSGSEPLVLDQVMREVAEHPGNVWTPVISLHREDAVKLGYTKVSDWQAMLNIVMPKIAESMKIHPDHLRWYAAFHDADTHPHIHMVLYSTNPTEGFLTKQGIQKIKSALANEIQNANFHALRHTFATRALEHGMDIVTLSRILGHANPSITLDKYGHAQEEHKKRSINMMGDIYQNTTEQRLETQQLSQTTPQMTLEW